MLAVKMTIIDQNRGRRPAARTRLLRQLLLPVVFCALLVPAAGYAEEMRLLNLGLRVRISGETVLGKDQPEEFKAYDLSANFNLPWRRNFGSGWGIGTRLMTSVGTMRGGGESGFVFSLAPAIAWEREDRRVFVDAGAGAALLSRYQFGTQDFGGTFQFALTAGAGFPLNKSLGLGYRYMHYSDAGLHGSGTTGADFHMIEFSYWFGTEH